MKDGMEVYLNLCESCASKIQVSPVSEPEADLFSGFFKDVLETEAKPIEDLGCPVCGSTLSELRSDGRLGCERCYEVFSSELEYLIQNASGARRHRGRLPENLSKMKTILVDKAGLKRKLKKAISNENYERAAKIRDKIERLENGD
jgi:protein arginine kinase activator